MSEFNRTAFENLSADVRTLTTAHQALTDRTSRLEEVREKTCDLQRRVAALEQTQVAVSDQLAKIWTYIFTPKTDDAPGSLPCEDHMAAKGLYWDEGKGAYVPGHPDNPVGDPEYKVSPPCEDFLAAKVKSYPTVETCHYNPGIPPISDMGEEIIAHSSLRPSLIKVMCEAYTEMNIIRARDGVPRGSDVTQKHWDSVMARLDAEVMAATGHGCWLHPILFNNE